MTEQEKKALAADPDGLISYEYLANNIGNCDDCIGFIIDNMARVDLSGQFLASAARYLNAIDPVKFEQPIRTLVAHVIDRDREHRYLPDILQGIYGPDYQDRAEELIAVDNNFRRIYKRIFPLNTI